MKYIVISKKVGSITREFPILFPNDLSHLDVATALLATCPEVKGGKLWALAKCLQCALMQIAPVDLLVLT